jgi:hypothetical protein
MLWFDLNRIIYFNYVRLASFYIGHISDSMTMVISAILIHS